MHNYYKELLLEADMDDNRENIAAVEAAIKFILEMEEIPEYEYSREVGRWISDPTSAKRTMVIRRLRETK